ncbi:major facilitator superfamily transporter [Colletotrichum falcatum]|nr:major facilitator superfamily transporter [Colletotrichum falcatum]
MASPSVSEKQGGRTSINTLPQDRTVTATADVNLPRDDKLASDRSSNDASDDDNGGHLAQEPSNAPSVWLAETMSLPREIMFIIICCMAQFCTQAAYIDSLFLLHVIGSSFHVEDPARLAWLVAGYSLTIGTFILFSGRLGDAFGYKRMLIIGFAWFSVWSLAAGLSVYSSFTVAVLSRVLQGIGPAVCLPNALALFGAAYPPGHRKAMLPPPSGLRAVLVELDVPGAVTGVASLVLFNFAWNMAPISGWRAPVVLAPLVLGLVLFAAFALIEFKYAPMPLLPFDVVNADVGFVLGAVVCGWATFGVWTLYLVQILQEIRHLSPLLTCAWFAPVVVTGGMAAVITGRLLGPLQVRPPVVMTMALASFTTGVILTATAPQNQVYWAQIFVSMLVMPFGMDMSFPAATLILSDAVKKEHQGIGASLVNTVVNYGIALGVGFAGTVEVQINNGGRTKEDQFRGFRGALYMGVGLAGLGLSIALTFLAREWRHRNARRGSDEKAAEAQADT